MLVRAGDGEWLQLRPVGDLPPDGFRSLCGEDAANLLELDEPLPVAAFGEPGDQGMVDAICLTREGGIALLAATFGERPDSTLWRLMNVAGALRGMSLELFAANCSEVHDRTPAQWLADRIGGDAGAYEARMRETLEQGAFELVLVTTDGPGELATPMRFLQQGPASVRVYEIEVMRAGDVQAVEGAEVTLDGERAAPRRVLEAAPAEQSWQPQSQPEAEQEWEQEQGQEPNAGWRPEAAFEQAAQAFEAELSQDEEPAEPEAHEPEAELHEPVAESFTPEPEAAEETQAEDESSFEPEAEADVAEEPQLQSAPEVEPEPLGVPSTEESFISSVDRLDHKSSAHMRYLHGRLLALVGATEYTRDDRMEYFVGWTREEQPRPLVGLDSDGAFTVVLSSLPTEEQAEYAAELAGLTPDGDSSRFMELGVAELSVPEHLNDQTLLEYVIDNLQEALPGGRELFEAAAAAAEAETAAPHEVAAPATPTSDADEASEDVGDDFFAGVSAGHDPQEIAAAVGGGHADEPVAEQPATPEPQAEPPKEKGGFARRLRRRDAA